MPDNDSTTDWHQHDQRWCQFTYLDYIADKPPEQFELLLRQVVRPIFAPDQPEEFALFAGCSAHLDLSVLELDAAQQRQLLHGLASTGVRIPGTRFVLRVARPWYALFEERDSDYPTLPHDWMEALRLIKVFG